MTVRPQSSAPPGPGPLAGPVTGPPAVPVTGPPAPRRGPPSARWTVAVVLLSVAIVVVLVVGGGYVVHLLARDAPPATGRAAGTPSAAPATPPSPDDPGPVTLTAPARLDGRPAVPVSREIRENIAAVTGTMTALPSPAGQVSGFYSARSDRSGGLWFVARPGPVAEPRRAFDDMFATIHGAVGGTVRVASAAPLGGHARCIDTTDDDRKRTVICGWADRRSMGVVVRYDADPQRFIPRFGAMRSLIERRA